MKMMIQNDMIPFDDKFCANRFYLEMNKSLRAKEIFISGFWFFHSISTCKSSCTGASKEISIHLFENPLPITAASKFASMLNFII